MNDRPQTQRPWDMDLSEAKEWAIQTLRDNAETPEQIEVFCTIGSFIRIGWFDDIMIRRKRLHGKHLKAQRLAKKGARK